VETRRLIPLVVLIGFGLACGAVTGAIDQIEEASNDVPVPDFDLFPEELPSGDSQPGPSVLNLDDPSLYQYRDKHFTTSTIFEFDSSVSSGFVFIEGAWAAGSPPSYSFLFDTSLDMWIGFAPLEIANQDGVLYSSSAIGECSIDYTDYDDPFDGYYMDENYLTGEAPLLESGMLVSGMTTDRYSITHENILNEEDSAIYDFIAVDTLGSVYVDRATGVIVRFKQSGQGLDRSNSDEGLEIEYTLQVDFELLDSPPPISIPEGCDGEGTAEQDLGGGSAEDIPFPIMDDAFNITGAFGLYGYETSYSFDEVIEFYREEMALLGFALDSELVAAPTALMQFSNDSGTVVVTVGEDETGTGLAVVIVDSTSP
jgi:hypothetical protein